MSIICNKCGSRLFWDSEDNISECERCKQDKNVLDAILDIKDNIQKLVDLYKYANNLKINGE